MKAIFLIVTLVLGLITAFIFIFTRLLLRHKLLDSVWILDNSSSWCLQTTTLLEVMSANKSWALFAHGLQSYLLSGFVLLGRQQIRQGKCECVCVHADDDPGPRGCWGTRPHPDNRGQCCQISCDIVPGPQPAIRLSTLPKTALKTLWIHRYPINTMTCFRVQGWELFFSQSKFPYSTAGAVSFKNWFMNIK